MKIDIIEKLKNKLVTTKIPIITLGNSPITKNYSKKVDFLKKAGII